MAEEHESNEPDRRDLEEGLAAEVVIAVASGAAGGAAAVFARQVAEKIGHKEKTEAPKIELPPGADRED
jgi:hypothetical protein